MERFVVQPMASSKGYFGMMCQLHLIAAIYNDGTSGVWEMAVLMHSDYDSAFLKLFFFFSKRGSLLRCIPILSMGMLVPAQRPRTCALQYFGMQC